jgi:hypothetical protein
MTTNGSTGEVLFLTPGVLLIGVGVAILISNLRNRKNMSVVNPAIKNETRSLVNSSATIQKDFMRAVYRFL